MPVDPAANLELADLEQQLGQWSQGLNEAQLNWASGYLAGLAAARGPSATVSGAAQPQAGGTVTIWYGSETGNGRGVAERLAREAESKGLSVELASTADVQPRSIAKVGTLLLVMSTHGEGDPPEDAEALHKFIMSGRTPKLDDLKFAVFALGDSSYPDFCQTGRDFDVRLAELGASRMLDRVDVDVDFESTEDAWRERIFEKLDEELPASEAVPSAAPHLQLIRGKPAAAAFDRRNPFDAEVLEIAPLTVAPSTSPVHHVELLLPADQLQGSGLQWQPGDSLGLWPRHDARLVDEIVQATGIDEATRIERGGETLEARTWLESRLELTQLARPFIEAWAGLAESQRLRTLLDDRGAWADWVGTRQVIDVLREFPAGVDAEALIGALRGIAPRLYSIASSPLVVDDEVHLTVKRVGGIAGDGRLRAGVASWQLTDSVAPGDRVPVYLEANPRFRLPEDPATPMIMIGPGTGVAPFRAFVQQRQAAGAAGENWLFFGARNRETDFLYQLEWQRFQRQGALARLSVAFSRDQADKVYVQHQLREQGRDVHDWLERGAHVYICGDGQRMSADVHQALIDIVAEHGGRSEEQSIEYLEAMKRAKRYQKDVY
ncbi:MAG: assimilatory sulfite reductase (NADPH) flavoprotein subunit [Wenzhouxiangellaceae bacterium]|nr:assimilatory sulfite reductase (NADPH) flavoprotein subunit [Wenzhouxiangellaceae bacterium]